MNDSLTADGKSWHGTVSGLAHRGARESAKMYTSVWVFVRSLGWVRVLRLKCFALEWGRQWGSKVCPQLVGAHGPSNREVRQEDGIGQDSPR